MILTSLFVKCDNCGENGGGIAAHHWIPGEYLPKPDIPKGWQLILSSNGAWESFCIKCSRTPGATK